MKPTLFSRNQILLGILVCYLTLTSVAFAQAAPNSTSSQPLFSETKGVIPLDDTPRRKWDNAVVADFDQDGKMDLLLTEHSKEADIYWNEGGKFSKPVKVIGGDTHGVAVGDYDGDGRVDIVIYHGGGGGKKPRNPVAFHVTRDRKIEGGESFEEFDRTRGRATKLIDTNNDGTLDLVLSGFPLDTQKVSGANQLYTQNGDGKFEMASKLPQAQWMGFKTLATDFNNDGDTDVIFYGGKNMVALKGETGHAFSEASGEVLGALKDTGFVSSLTEIDCDNDGDFDLLATRADHHFDEETEFDDQGKRFSYFVFAAFVNDVRYQYDLKIDGNFQMENLQMAFPTFDVFLGAEMKPLAASDDRHGGRNLTLKPDEAQGYPAQLTKNGLFIGYLGNGIWRVGGNTKSATSGVVLNVNKAPAATPSKSLPVLLLENRNGKFVDVTQTLGISIDEQTTSAASGDLNNDGWCDLVIVRNGSSASANEQMVYLNQGGQSFRRVENSGIVAGELGVTGGNAELLDYDEDGDLDLIYSTERGRWHLMANNTIANGNNNFVVVKVGASPNKKATAQGAVLTLKAGGNTYKRVVGATSANFSQGMNTHLHVGLGAINKIDEATVRWSNGETQTLSIDGVNKSVVAGR